MDSLPPCMQVFAEEASALVIELSAGLLERPAPSEDQKCSLVNLCIELTSILEETLPAIKETIKEINSLALESSAEEVFSFDSADELAELVEELGDIALDLVAFARKIWSCNLPFEQDGVKPFLARLAEVPVVELLAVLQPLVHAAVVPDAFYDEPSKAKLNLHFSGNYSKEKAELAAYCKRNSIKIPEELVRI